MRSSFVLSMSVAAVALSAGFVLAGTPLPDPPFSSGGFVPPDSLTYREELNVGKVLTKYAATVAKCDMKAVIALQLAYEPENMGKVPDVQASWTSCRQKNADKYAALRDALVAKGTPACLDAAGIDAFRAAIDLAIPTFVAAIYCDDDAASPDPVTGINIPDFKIEASGEVSIAKVILKAGASAGKCYTKAAGYAFKFGGTLPPEVLTKINDCLAKYQAGGIAAMDKLDQTQKIPACLTLEQAHNMVTAAVALAGQYSDDNYCASPSGAFLD
jgi:hypothetical protein